MKLLKRIPEKPLEIRYENGVRKTKLYLNDELLIHDRLSENSAFGESIPFSGITSIELIDSGEYMDNMKLHNILASQIPIQTREDVSGDPNVTIMDLGNTRIIIDHIDNVNDLYSDRNNMLVIFRYHISQYGKLMKKSLIVFVNKSIFEEFNRELHDVVNIVNTTVQSNGIPLYDEAYKDLVDRIRDTNSFRYFRLDHIELIDID